MYTDVTVQSSRSKEIKLVETLQLLSFQKPPTAHFGVHRHLLPMSRSGGWNPHKPSGDQKFNSCPT